MSKKKTRRQAYKPLHKWKTKRGCTPKKQRDEQQLVTIKDYGRYVPLIEELKSHDITPDNIREHWAEVEEIVNNWAAAEETTDRMKGGE